ncbi:MFS transporter [Rouxiella badensis]|uniref:MFS transporter n=2 Tax=Rouxiella badensis TaxID=1646377 RepID=UPI00178783D3|nr:MFS transporter [Rouxiella badensis]QOI57991.1 MFS transporter [Rouxiella badensis subsp. acadiensis]
MPIVIYIFSLCAFALGLTEFLVIGLVSAISKDLHSSIEAVGMTVTSYAIGATIGAPFLTALTSNWSRKTVMLSTMLVFSVGSLAATLSTNVHMMLISRFVAGLAHGLFLAVAASVATQIVAPEKRGTAVSYVFAGLTLALAFGVPIGTYLGSVISWRLSFMSVTICGIVGLIGLIFFMPNTKTHSIEDTTHPFKALTQIFNPVLLFGALITVLGYTGAFTLYTYISPLLLDITKVSIQTASSMMLIYGICAAVGNILGGKLSDKLGVDKAVAWIMFLLTLSLVGINFYGMNTIIMCILIGAMGAISYAAVPAMQARVISIAHTYVPRAVPVASGLNIAGFNSGIALGSLLGGFIITSVGVRYLAIGGASISFIGLSILIFSTLSKRQPSHSQ